MDYNLYKQLNNQLIEAVQNKNLEEAKRLLLEGANPDADFEYKHTNGGSGRMSVLDAANGGNNVPMVRLLLLAGADPDYGDPKNKTTLSWAATCGRTEIARLLLLAGANPNAKDRYGTTPLYFANQRSEIVRILRVAGAK